MKHNILKYYIILIFFFGIEGLSAQDQGDTLDYQNLISLEEHAQKLTQKLGMTVEYIDDVAGPAAQAPAPPC